MPTREQKYHAWCEKMAAKAAMEEPPPPPACSENQFVDFCHSPKHVSNAESFHRHSSRLQSKRPTSTAAKRRTMSDTKVSDIKDSIQRDRTGTWPRSARSSISLPKPRPSVPNRGSSSFSTPSRHRPDLRSLHRESCQLFSSIDATMTDSGYSSIYEPGSSTFTSTTSLSQDSTPVDTLPRCSTAIVRSREATVMSWTSDETRRMEYSKIDEAHSGLRGLYKKVLPKCCQSRRSWRRFFEGKCDGDSVRRVRMPFSDDDEKADI